MLSHLIAVYHVKIRKDSFELAWIKVAFMCTSIFSSMSSTTTSCHSTTMPSFSDLSLARGFSRAMEDDVQTHARGFRLKWRRTSSNAGVSDNVHDLTVLPGKSSADDCVDIKVGDVSFDVSATSIPEGKQLEEPGVEVNDIWPNSPELDFDRMSSHYSGSVYDGQLDFR